MTHSVKKIFVTVIGISALIIVIAGYAVGDYFVDYALKRGNETDPLAPPAACISIHDKQMKIPAMPEASTEKWNIISNEGRRLVSTFYSSVTNDHRWVILVHGYGRDQRYVRDYVRAYLDKKWNVLTPDLCASGESEGQYITMGVKESEEIVSWAYKIKARDPDAEIVLHGVSMGAAAVLMSAGRYSVPGLKSVIDDCSYTSAYEMFTNQLDVLFGLPEFPIMLCIDIVSGIKTDAKISDASPQKVISEIKVPVMFIHGSEDTLVPPSMMEKLYSSCNSPKTKLVVKGAGHGDAMKDAGNDYWKAVFSFLENTSS